MWFTLFCYYLLYLTNPHDQPWPTMTNHNQPQPTTTNHDNQITITRQQLYKPTPANPTRTTLFCDVLFGVVMWVFNKRSRNMSARTSRLVSCVRWHLTVSDLIVLNWVHREEQKRDHNTPRTRTSDWLGWGLLLPSLHYHIMAVQFKSKYMFFNIIVHFTDLLYRSWHGGHDSTR